jgi:hypothetical protein
MERLKYPLLKAGNVVFIFASALLVCGVGIAALLLYSSIVE